MSNNFAGTYFHCSASGLNPSEVHTSPSDFLYTLPGRRAYLSALYCWLLLSFTCTKIQNFRT